MSAEKLGVHQNNRAHTPARFITLTAGDGKAIFNMTCIISITPIRQSGVEGEIESSKGQFKSMIQVVTGQTYRVQEPTSVISQLLSGDGVHGTSR